MISEASEALANWVKLSGHLYSFAGYICSVISLVITTVTLWKVRNVNGSK